MKHKHADLIHAWADGAEIQYQNRATLKWADICTPNWDSQTPFRIKPEEKKPVVRWLWADDKGRVAMSMMSIEENTDSMFQIKLEWSRTEFPE